MRRFLSDSTFKTGDAIVSVEAFAAVVDDSHLRLACSNCFCLHEERSLRQCSGCKVLKYCSAACQRNDWVDHAAECKAFVVTKPRIPSRTVRLLARCLRRGFREDWVAWPEVTALVTNADSHPASDIEQYGSLVMVLRAFMPECAEMPEQASPRHLLDLFCALRCNASVISTAELVGVGLGLYLRSATINHSCIPNGVVSYSGRTQKVYAVADISTGSEVTISYVDLYLPGWARRRSLQSSHFFTCACRRCQDDAAESQSDLVLSGLRCPRCSTVCVPSLPVVGVPTSPPSLLAAALCAYGMDVCDTALINRVISGVELGDDWLAAVDTTLLGFKCSSCEVVVDDPSIAMQLLHAIADVKTSTSEPSLMCKPRLLEAERTFHTYLSHAHHLSMTVAVALVDIYVAAEEWDSALQCTAALVERMRVGLSTFLPKGTAACIPFSLYVLRWAKLLHLRGRCKEASVAFEESIRSMSVALGHEHKLVRNARAQQAEAHAEATSS